MAKKQFNLAARVRSFKHAIRGIGVMFKTQHNSWIHFLAVLAVVALGIYTKLNLQEWVFISLAIGLVLVAELANTALEYLGDAISQDNDDNIKNAKDIAAGAVLVAAMVAIMIVFFMTWPLCFSYLKTMKHISIGKL